MGPVIAGNQEETTGLLVRLHSITYAARDINIYELCRPDGAALPAAEPGAHIDVHLPNGLVRQYSLIRSGQCPTRYQIAVKRDPLGQGGSRFLHGGVPCGTELRISVPRNNFPLSAAPAHAVLIAGGIGITPIRAMAEALAAAGRPFELHYACRARADAAFLNDLAGFSDRVRLHFDDEQGGAVLDLAAIVSRAPPGAHLYCCGPLPMLAGFEAVTAGLHGDRVHAEYFTPKSAAAVAGGFVVELARSSLQLTVPPGKTILEVVEDAGITVSYSCREGVCGACETKVLAGQPDHRDSILSTAERAAGKTMMICCSGSLGPRLILGL